MNNKATALELQDFFLQAPIPLAILNGSKHLFTLANSAYEKLVGRKVEGKTVEEAFTNEEVGSFIPLLDKVYLTGIPYVANEISWAMTDLDGFVKKYWINIAYHPSRDSEGRIIGIIVFVNDVTSAVNARTISEGSENHFRILSNSLPNMIWTSTPEGHIYWFNDFWYKYTGSSKSLISNESWLNTIHPDDVKMVTEVWSRAISKKHLFKKELRIKKKSTGEYRWHISVGMPVKDENGHIFRWIGSYTDIHDQKLNVQLLEQERDLKEAFVSTLSHDLRTPLTVAKLSAQTIAKKLSDDPKIYKTAHRISINMDRADKMIQDILDASFIKAGEKLPLKIGECSLNHLLQTITEELCSVYGDRFKVESSQQIDGHWDSEGLRRVFENLLLNAVKYGKDSAIIRVILSLKNQMAKISICNEGQQISSADLKLLFTRFKRTADSRSGQQKGWGLGLTLVKGITEAHGGTTNATSLKDGSTTFTITLPLDSRNCELQKDDQSHGEKFI